MVAGILLARAGGSVASAADDPPTSEAQPSDAELLKELQAMKKRISVLEQELRKRKATKVATPPRNATQPAAATAETTSLSAVNLPAPSPPPVAQATPEPPPSQNSAPPAGNKDLFGLAPSPIAGLKIGTYGEFNFGYQQNPAANGQWQFGSDLARLVLLPSYKFNDNIVFNAEIEFEHAGTAFDNDDKQHGSAEIEQAWVDFLISPYFNVRAPGIDLVPVGYINLYHEPTLFYSVRRPEIPNGLANGLIPTTWREPAASIHGMILDNLNYQFQLSSSLEDFGDAFEQRTPANTVPPGPYMAGIDSINGLNFSQAPRGGFAQLTNQLGYAGRLSYTPPFIPGFAGSTSLYYSPNIEPRGAHADGVGGQPLGHTSLTLVDSEFRYRIPNTGFELRDEYAQVFFGNSANLRANNDGDPTNNVGSMMIGLSTEIAYHVPLGELLGSDWEAVPFFRYSYLNRFAGKFSGSDLNEPSGAGRQHYYTMGVAVFPTPELVLKLDYQHITDSEPGGAKSDSVLGSVGWFF
jgi:hypothetical protein